MSGFKMGRINEDIKRELTDIFRTLKDPRIQGLITIVSVDTTNDLSLCKVHISSIDGIDSAKKNIEGLNSAKGFIRRELGTRLSLRRSPDFRFIPNDGAEYSARISKILNPSQ